MKDSSWIETFVQEYVSPTHTCGIGLIPCTACDGKAAIETHIERIIGEKLKPIDVGALTGPANTPITSSLTAPQAAYLTAHNSLINEQYERAGINLKGGAK